MRKFTGKRKFGNRIYRYFGTATNKEEAKELKRKALSGGNRYVRVIKDGYSEYNIYVNGRRR